MEKQVVRFVYHPDQQIAWVDHWVATTPMARAAARRSLMVTVLVVMIVTLAGWIVFKTWTILAAGGGALVWLVTQHGKLFRARVRKDSGAASTELGDLRIGSEQRVEAGPDGLRVASPASDCIMSWRAVQSVDAGPDHAFLGLGQIRAVVIPRAGLIEGDFDAFVSAARHWQGSARR